MKLSTKSRYGLRVLLQIAMDAETHVVTGRELAETQEISEPYLEQIMIPLKKSGMVSTVRGCHGGYRLKKSALEITVLDIIELFEGELSLVKCIDDKEVCSRHHVCTTSFVWNELSRVLREKAQAITLAHLVFQTKQRQQPEFMI